MSKVTWVGLWLLIACSLMILGCAASEQKAADGSDEVTIKALEEKWDAATAKVDLVTVDAILADTFVSTGTEGQFRTKPEVLASLKSGATKYEASKLDDMRVFLYGDAAVVTGRWTGKGVEEGKPFNEVDRWTDTFIKQNGQWRCASSQSTVVPQSGGDK
jgi:ketosteroid isomerase-like protein